MFFHNIVIKRIQSINKTRGMIIGKSDFLESELNLFLAFQLNYCNGLTTMPSLIDCFRLHTLTLTNNSNLTSLIDASLETCTSLIDLSIRDNNDLIASNGRLSSTVYPMLKRLHVSLAVCSSRHAIDDV
jgi:hypothetical protein